MKKKRIHVSFLNIMAVVLAISSMTGEAGVLVNMMSPIVYGPRDSWNVSEKIGQLTDHIVGVITPLWIIEKDTWASVFPENRELYPSNQAMAVLNEERQTDYDTSLGGEGDTNDEILSQDSAQAATAPVASGEGILYTAEMLRDTSYLMSQFYLVDASTYADGLLDAEVFINMDLSVDLSEDEPKVLIYHTHSQEEYADSRPGVWQDTVVGVGDRLKSELEERYQVSVLHLTDTFDVVDGVGDRSEAYTYAEERVREVLEENPSIEVVIDLHRDGVDENTHLVTNINGKDTAKLMLLNGLCRTTANGPISYLQNDYLTENLAFSFQIQRKAAEYYPDLMRRIYLRSYQYNLHILPRCLLVECGAQTNTVEEAKNAMPLLADMLYLVLTEKIYDK